LLNAFSRTKKVTQLTKRAQKSQPVRLHPEPRTWSRIFDEAAAAVARAAGRPSAFGIALIVIVVWGVSGPIFRYSDTWQLIINTGTTIVTFLMVFLIQNAQNRDSAAIQVKLDEIVRSGNAENTFVGIEHLTEEEIEDLRAKCEARAAKTGK
jgi:low affinity Fe/Cu permease